jgi:trimeric autotransporter adhesin
LPYPDYPAGISFIQIKTTFMKPKHVVILLLSVFGAASIGKAQLQYGKKLTPPAKNVRDEMMQNFDKKNRNLPYTYFDSVSKQFVRVGLDGNLRNSQSFLSGVQPSTKIPPPGSNTVFHLTKDINTLAESYPENNPANTRYSFAVLNNVAYFIANDGINGRELWRSDGTAAGTYMVKDVDPGESGIAGIDIVAANGLLYFTGYTPENGQEPWISDGTADGTHLLKDINPGSYDSRPNQFAAVGNQVFFVVTTYNQNEQLWKTDGTEAGTMLVTDLASQGIGYRIFELTEANNLAYFIAYTFYYGYQLFRSDGTWDGTYNVKTIGYNYDYNGTTAPMQLTEYNNKLYFSADDGYGRKLWESDGTYGGTFPEVDNGVVMSSDFLDIYRNHPFPILNNILYTPGYILSDVGAGLYKFDAANSGAGMTLVKDLTDIPDYPYDNVVDFVTPTDFTIVNDNLYFKVISNQGNLHDELWSTNGETDQTQMFKIIGPGEAQVASYNFCTSGGLLYFDVSNDPAAGTELWKSDGTEAGTVLVKDIYSGKGNSSPDDLTDINGRLLFRAFTLETGSELWSTTGTEASTSLVKDINTTSTNGSDAGFMFKGIGETKNGIVFNAFTNALGGELYKSDGTAAGTFLLNDIATGTDWSYPNNYLFKNGLTYFIADNAQGTAIYRTDGTTGGLRRVTEIINRDLYYVINYNVADNGLVFYTLGKRTTGEQELWRSNGTPAGTFMLTSNLSYFFANYVEVIGNMVFFIGGDFNTGYELWKSDGTVAGTRLVKDINPGPNGSDPYSLFVYNKTLYFGAFDGQSINFHRSLWKSDGSEKGTVKVANIEPTYYSPYFNTEPQHVFCVSGNNLFVAATEYDTYGTELWITNGTDKGTKLVKNINPTFNSNPTNLTDVNGILYFTADDGIHGNELWSTDGKEYNTKMVKDISPDYTYSDLRSLCNAGGKLFFLYANTFPQQLWTSDGTESGTKQVVDDGLIGVTNISELTAVGDKLFFGAFSSKTGNEMYSGTISSKFHPLTMNEPSEVKDIQENFDATLYPNPSPNRASLLLKGNTKSASVVVTDIAGKLIWRGDFNAERSINLPVERLKAGVYLVTVKTDKGSKTLRFVKE